MEKNTAIVLKSYIPQKKKLALLDKQLGKIMAVPNRDFLSQSALISYYYTKQNGIYFLHSIDIIDVPLLLAQEDILFIHHILEIGYYFVPMGTKNTRLFDIVYQLYSMQLLHKSLIKKVFLFQCFVAIGLYPENASFQTPFFHQLASLSIDNIDAQNLDLVNEAELDMWLQSCFALHPCVKNFKTLHFLKSK